MIITGDPSGDRHAAELVKALRRKDPCLEICGIGGAALAQEGVRLFADASELSVVGVTEAFPKLKVLWTAMRKAKYLLKRFRPNLLILIDFPDFNLHLAATARRIGVPVLYYICPQVWAWRSGRVRKIRRRVTHAAVILPFEESFFKFHDIPVTFVGHPLMDAERSDLHAQKPLFSPPESPVIGLLPGSRDGEVRRHLPVLLETARNLNRQHRNIRFILSAAPSVKPLFSQLDIRSRSDSIHLEISDGPVQEVFKKSTLVIAASGTVTLEAAVFGVPMIIVYKVSALSHLLGRLLIKVPFISLVNLIAGRSIVPELIQQKASSQRIADTVVRMIDTPGLLEKQHHELLKIRGLLGGEGASERTAGIALDMMKQKD